jgi:hypothetical protein
MSKQFETQISRGANACGLESADKTPDSPVNAALTRVREEISECHYWVDILINGAGPALRPASPSEDKTCLRPQAASPLADEIEQIAENIRNIRSKVMDARERLTL